MAWVLQSDQDGNRQWVQTEDDGQGATPAATPNAPTTPADPSGGYTPAQLQAETQGGVNTAITNATQQLTQGSHVQDAGGPSATFTAFIKANPQLNTNGQQAIAAFDQFFPQYAGTGKYYPGQNIFGFPDSYLTFENGQWKSTGRGAEGAGGSGTLGQAIDPSYLAPFTQAPPQMPAQGSYTPGTFQAPAPYQVPEFKAPAAFQAPTGDSILQDPSYQFRVNQGEQQLQQSAAGQGLLNTGGTLKDVLNYGQNAASQEYSNVWNRGFSNWQQDWQNALQGYQATTNAGLAGGRLGLDTATQGFNAQEGANEFGANFNQNAAQSAYNNAWQQYLTARDTFYSNQTNPFNKILNVAQVGAGAASAS